MVQKMQAKEYESLVCIKKLQSKLFERSHSLNLPTTSTISTYTNIIKGTTGGKRKRQEKAVFSSEETQFATTLFNCLRTAPKNHKLGGYDGVRYHFVHLWSVGRLCDEGDAAGKSPQRRSSTLDVSRCVPRVEFFDPLAKRYPR